MERYLDDVGCSGTTSARATRAADALGAYHEQSSIPSSGASDDAATSSGAYLIV